MSNPDENYDHDFDAQLRGLFVEAEQAIEDRPQSVRTTDPERDSARANPDKAAPASNLPQMLRPVIMGLEAVMRATAKNSEHLAKLDHMAGSAIEARANMQQTVSELRVLVDQKNGLTQKMFDAMHEELKGYKDSFLLELVQKPVIRDLISLYDECAEIRRQIGQLAEEVSGVSVENGAICERLRKMEQNVACNCEFLIEVLARLEVLLVPMGTGKLDKRTQRAVTLEAAADTAEDGDIVRWVRRGFMWKGRLFRPEEVVVKKWKSEVPIPVTTGTSEMTSI